ncbi:MAG: hypothetical protein EON47_04105, partial [Acetobacteraceae bacterium]
SPLATRIFALGGVARVFLGGDFITVTQTDGAEHLRAQGEPLGVIGLRHGDEVAAEEDARHATEREDAGGERAAGGRGCGGEVGRSGRAHHVPPGQEFQGGGVRGAFGFDEHGSGVLPKRLVGYIRTNVVGFRPGCNPPCSIGPGYPAQPIRQPRPGCRHAWRRGSSWPAARGRSRPWSARHAG